VGPRAVLDTIVKRIIPSLRRESNPRNPIVQPVAQTLDWKTLDTRNNSIGIDLSEEEEEEDLDGH
jgi:hypothetical protein